MQRPTNPTPPLTAEALAKIIIDIYCPVYSLRSLGVPSVSTRIEAYAAQQNAELLTHCEKLKAKNEQLKQELATVTAGRDALRRKLDMHINATNGPQIMPLAAQVM